jgi:hypothetical protein
MANINVCLWHRGQGDRAAGLSLRRISRIEGVPKAGERLKVVIQPVGGKSMTFRPTVLVATRDQELRWLGRFLLPSIFDGEHYFKIISIGPNRVRFVHGEKFSGILVPLAKSGLEGGTKAGFVAMNQAIKIRAESDEP